MTSSKSSGLKIGNRIAPPRFIAYAIGLALVAAYAAFSPGQRIEYFLVGFDSVTFLFLASLIPLLSTDDPQEMGRHARDNDANRIALLVIAIGICAVILGALTVVVLGKGSYSKLLVVVTLGLCWLFANVVYALHYAHLYYRVDDAKTGGEADAETGEQYAGGLSIPSTDAPDYHDFLHFSLILGMTFQTADINITSSKIRRVSTWHCIEAFVFNIGIIAFTINMLGS